MLPLEDFWIKIRLGIFGGLGVSSMPGRMGCLPKGCLPLLLVALLVVLTLAGWLLLRNGGDATLVGGAAPIATDTPTPTPTATNTPTPTNTPPPAATNTPTPTPTPTNTPLPIATDTPTPTPTPTATPLKAGCVPQTHADPTNDAVLIDGNGNVVGIATTQAGGITGVDIECDINGNLLVWVDRSIVEKGFSSAVIISVGSKTYFWEFHNNVENKSAGVTLDPNGSRVCFIISVADLAEEFGDQNAIVEIESFYQEEQSDPFRTNDTAEVEVD